MNGRLILIKCITLLYCESIVEGNKDKSKELVQQVVPLVKLPELAVAANSEYDILDGLRTMALEMASDSMDLVYDSATVTQRIRIICLEEQTLFEIFKETLDALKERDPKRICVGIRSTLNTVLKNEKIKNAVVKAATKLKFEPEKITDMGAFAQDIVIELEGCQAQVDNKDPAIIMELDTTDREGFVHVMDSVKEQESGVSNFICGWQAINRMLGNQLRRGAFIVVPALPHMNKTGFCFNFFRQSITYNKPHMIDQTKKPLAVWMSFEDDIENNIRMMYVSCRCNETRAAIPKEEMDSKTSEEMSDYIIEHLSKTGYYVKILRINPSDWTYRKTHQKIQEYEADGYEVHILGLDYLSLVPTVGCTQGTGGYDLRDLFRRTRNWTNARKITVITPHQLSPDAKRLIREGKQAADFVKDLPGKGFYDGSTKIDQEVDIELFIHIAKFNGRAYQTVQRGKHRGIVGQTPDQFLYTVLPFINGADGYNSGVLDDVGYEDSSMRKLGAGSGLDGDDAWFN